MYGIKEFKTLMQRLSILTGKTPTVFGKPPQSPKEMEYMIEIYHDELKHNELCDIEAAFQDRRLREEIANGYSLNVSVIEKYITMHRNKRTGKKKEDEEKRGDFKPIPAACKKKLQTFGIDLDNMAEEKSI